MDILTRFTSRKFILASLTYAFAILAALGIVPAADAQKDIAMASPAVFILIEGLADLVERRKLSAASAAAIAAEAGRQAALAVLAAQAPNVLATAPAEAASPAA